MVYTIHMYGIYHTYVWYIPFKFMSYAMYMPCIYHVYNTYSQK